MFEFDVYNTIGYDLNVELPYKYIIKIKDYFISSLKNTDLFTVASNFINDSYKIPLCLYYHPMLIATASLFLISIHLKVDLPDKDGIPWFKLLDSNIDRDTIVNIAKRITIIYKHISIKDEVKNKSFRYNFNNNDTNDSNILINELISNSDTTNISLNKNNSNTVNVDRLEQNEKMEDSASV